MTHKRIICSILALALLLSLCACSKPRLVTSDKLEVEIKGEGTKTLTVNIMGPVNSLYPSEITGPEGEDAAFSVKSTKMGEDYIKLKLGGLNKGSGTLIVTYTDGGIYALANIVVSVDENMKLTANNVAFAGDDLFEALGEGMPEGSLISRESGYSRIVRLKSDLGPWAVEKFDDCLNVLEEGLSEEDQFYEFIIAGISNGSGSVYLTNKFEKQRVCLDFEVSTVVDGGIEALSLDLAGSSVSVYDISESEKYVAASGRFMENIRKFSPKVFIPAAAELKGADEEDGSLVVSLEMEGCDLGYLVFKDISLKDELELFKKEFPSAETDSFETNGANITLYQIEDYSAALWEKDGLLCELYIFDESDIYRAGDVVEAFLSSEAL